MASSRPLPPAALRTLAGILLVLLAGGADAAATTGQQARARTEVRYRLTVDFRAKDTYTQGGPDATVVGESNQIATYRAKSTRTFTIRRTSRPGSAPWFRFTAPMAGEFTWQGGGYGGTGAGGGCVYRWTEEVWPDKTAVSGLVRMVRSATPRILIAVSPDAFGQIGTVSFHPDASCRNTVQPFTSTSLILLNLPEQATEEVDLRRKFGRSFTIRYEPGALDDRPNTVAGDVRGVYDFAWTLRFTRVRR